MAKAFLTAYDWWDNTPPGSSAISHPVLHQKAGGKGTFADPVTLAVGHTLRDGQDILDFPAGTKVYIPSVRRYFIVEDTCGDGATPQNGPCHRLDTPGNSAPAGATMWLDMWIGGQSMDSGSASQCMDRVTGIHMVIFNPRSNFPVAPGEGVIHDGKCDAGYVDAIPQ